MIVDFSDEIQYLNKMTRMSLSKLFDLILISMNWNAIIKPSGLTMTQKWPNEGEQYQQFNYIAMKILIARGHFSIGINFIIKIFMLIKYWIIEREKIWMKYEKISASQLYIVVHN